MRESLNILIFLIIHPCSCVLCPVSRYSVVAGNWLSRACLWRETWHWRKEGRVRVSLPAAAAAKDGVKSKIKHQMNFWRDATNPYTQHFYPTLDFILRGALTPGLHNQMHSTDASDCFLLLLRLLFSIDLSSAISSVNKYAESIHSLNSMSVLRIGCEYELGHNTMHLISFNVQVFIDCHI